MNTTAEHNTRNDHTDRQPLGFGKGCAICDKFWAVEREATTQTIAYILKTER